MVGTPPYWSPSSVSRCSGTNVNLTAQGEALHRSLRGCITGPATRLLSQLESHDIETTVRTLQAITERAAEDSSPAE